MRNVLHGRTWWWRNRPARYAVGAVLPIEQTRPIAQVEEIDLSQPLTGLKTGSIEQIAETDVVHSLTVVKTVILGLLTESNTALPLSNGQSYGTRQMRMCAATHKRKQRTHA